MKEKIVVITDFANPSVQNVIESQSDGSTKQKELSTNTKWLISLPIELRNAPCGIPTLH